LRVLVGFFFKEMELLNELNLLKMISSRKLPAIDLDYFHKHFFISFKGLDALVVLLE